jgi:hypothetical protein
VERREVDTGKSKVDGVGAQMRVAESTAELATATLALRAAADRSDEVGLTGVRHRR